MKNISIEQSAKVKNIYEILEDENLTKDQKLEQIKIAINNSTDINNLAKDVLSQRDIQNEFDRYLKNMAIQY